ncbi:hypothetical protein VTO42DRAFT_4162 [Malbranchea cinnamomea]
MSYPSCPYTCSTASARISWPSIIGLHCFGSQIYTSSVTPSSPSWSLGRGMRSTTSLIALGYSAAAYVTFLSLVLKLGEIWVYLLCLEEHGDAMDVRLGISSLADMGCEVRLDALRELSVCSDQGWPLEEQEYRVVGYNGRLDNHVIYLEWGEISVIF